MRAFVSIAVALVLVAQCGLAQGACADSSYLCALKPGDKPAENAKPRYAYPPDWPFPWPKPSPRSGRIHGWVPPPAYYQPDLPTAKIPTEYPPSTVRRGLYFLYPKKTWTHRPGPF
uniref:Uncharacterized protein n=1 Tax=Rhipicephalus appendiculatus TaxID=34631 RepID=A0A131YF98_RHIAP